MSVRALESVQGIVDRGGDADDVLRAAVDVFVAEPGISFAGIRFLDGGELVLGPSAGVPDIARRFETTITYRGDPVGQLVVDGRVERALLDQVAALLSPYVLLGWDTGGDAWEP